MTNLSRSSVSAAKWSSLSAFFRLLLQFGAQVVLARILGPENYGVFAIGLVITTFSTFVSNFGLGQGLLFRKTITDEDVRFAFTWQLVAGVLMTALMWWFAAEIAGFFHEPRAEWVIQWLSLTCVLGAATSSANSLAQRQMKFKQLGMSQLASHALAYLVFGIPLALLGYGYHALVAVSLVQVLTLGLATYRLSRHSLRPLFRYGDAKTSLTYGALLFATNLLNWIPNNLAKMVVGRVMSPASLGIYSTGYNVATIPNGLIVNSLQPVLNAVGSRMQENDQRFAKALREVLGAVWVLGLPVCIAVAAGAKEVVAVLYGARWHGVDLVLVPMLLAMPAVVTSGLSTPLLWGSGRRHWEALAQVPVVIATGGILGGLAWAGRLDIATAAWATAGILVGRMVLLLAATLYTLRIPPGQFLDGLVRGALIGLVPLLAFGAVRALMPSVPPLVTLLSAWTLSLLPVLLAVATRPRLLGEPALECVGRFFPRLGRYIRRSG